MMFVKFYENNKTALSIGKVVILGHITQFGSRGRAWHFPDITAMRTEVIKQNVRINKLLIMKKKQNEQ